MKKNDIATCTYLGNALKPTCCKPAVEGRSYCEDHMWLVYQKGSAAAKRKKDQRRAEAIWDIESEFNAAVEELVLAGEIEL